MFIHTHTHTHAADTQVLIEYTGALGKFHLQQGTILSKMKNILQQQTTKLEEIDQANLELRGLPASSSQVQGLKVCVWLDSQIIQLYYRYRLPATKFEAKV